MVAYFLSDAAHLVERVGTVYVLALSGVFNLGKFLLADGGMLVIALPANDTTKTISCNLTRTKQINNFDKNTIAFSISVQLQPA